MQAWPERCGKVVAAKAAAKAAAQQAAQAAAEAKEAGKEAPGAEQAAGGDTDMGGVAGGVAA